jgi:ABC-type branched-subunit amino acid transport system substrate-binding protein
MICKPMICKLLLSLVILSLSATDAAEPLPPIVIGISNVQSGPSRSLGQELVEGSKAYFDTVNRAGGIHGRQIRFILKDDHYEPEPALLNTNDLILKDKVLFLFDYVGTPTLGRVLPLLPFYSDQYIVSVAPLTGAEAPRKPPYSRYVFNIRASYREEAWTLVDYLYAKGCRKFGFFGQADSYGKSGQVSVEEALKKYGLHITASVAYRRNTEVSSMQTQVDLLRAQGVDAVIAFGTYAPCSLFIRDARLANWQVPIANVSFVDATALLSMLRGQSRTANRDLTRNLINSQVVPFPDRPDCPLVKAYLENLHANGRGQIPGFTSLEGWLNAVVVAEALKRAGPNPLRAAFVAAMESLHGWDPGIGSKLEFSPAQHQALHKVWLTRTENSEWVPEAYSGAVN